MRKSLMSFGLRTRVTAASAITAAATAIVVLIGGLWIIGQVVDRANQRELQGHYQALQSALQQEAHRAAAMSALVALMPPVQEAMARGDRAALLGWFVAGFADLKASYGVDQFQFHTPPATSFARVHLPEKYGDDLSKFRQTVVEANAGGKTVVGLEGGVAGLGIRGVVPVSLAGKRLGTVEFGLSFGQTFFDQFKQTRHVDVAFHLFDQDTFKTLGGTLDGRSFFTPAEYRAAAGGSFLICAACSSRVRPSCNWLRSMALSRKTATAAAIRPTSSSRCQAGRAISWSPAASCRMASVILMIGPAMPRAIRKPLRPAISSAKAAMPVSSQRARASRVT